MRSTKGTPTGSCAQKHTDTNTSNANNTRYLGQPLPTHASRLTSAS